MYTPEDIENRVLGYLTPELTDFINGLICRSDERTSGGIEGVTVGTLSLTSDDIQLGIVNITIYIKDVEVRNVEFQKMDWKPNTQRFDEITRKIFLILNGSAGKYWKYGNLWITNPSPIYRSNPEIGEHFRTIRVQVKAHPEIWDTVL